MLLGAASATLLAAAGAGCGGGDDTPDMAPVKPVVTCTADKVTGSDSKLASDSLVLPKSTGGKTYSYDFDGDGKPENQLKNLANVISLSGLDVQKSIDDTVASGNAVILSDLKAADLMNATCGSITMGLAKAPAMGAPNPKFDGTDTFQLGDGTNVTLYGAITAGKLSTTASKDQTPANEGKIDLVLPLGMGMALPLSLRGAHVEGTVVMEGGVLKIKDGAIHGVLAQADIDGKIVPLVADMLTGLIHNDTKMGVPGDTAKAIIGLFEQKTGAASMAKCSANMMDCCRTNPATCKILPQEVKESSIGGVLAPDVQVLDAQGNWKPVAGGKMYNAMSVGIGFTSVKASF
jgi:hypothetical protein